MYIKVLGGRQNIYEQICSKARYRREDSCAPTESFWEVIICDIWPFIFRKGIAHPWVFISHGPPLEGPYHRAPCHSGPFKALGNAYPRYSRPLAHRAPKSPGPLSKKGPGDCVKYGYIHLHDVSYNAYCI